MFQGLENEYKDFVTIFDEQSKKYFESKKNQNKDLSHLWESMAYTFFLDGKRFRPFLSYIVATSYNVPFKRVFNYALAIEMIHTYSLIHDDLPCMDNDDFRRGKPSNHKVYGEDIALLAGDALLTEAFGLISDVSEIDPQLVIKTIHHFVSKIGAMGMVGGQVLDMKVGSDVTVSSLENIHLLKTGYLIEAAVVGTAILCGSDEKSLQIFSKSSQQLGIAFQIKDDLLDGLDSNQDYKNYIYLLGKDKTVNELNTITENAKKSLMQLSVPIQNLVKIFDFNVNRLK